MRPILLPLVLCGCVATTPSPAPSQAVAEAFLAHIIDVARARDFDALCDLGGGNCEDFLAEEGARDVPDAPPVIVGGRVIPPTGRRAGRVGGYVVEMCGRTDAGAVYYSEMLVFFDDAGELRAIEPPYWMGIRIAEDNVVGDHLNEGPPPECQGVL